MEQNQNHSSSQSRRGNTGETEPFNNTLDNSYEYLPDYSTITTANQSGSKEKVNSKTVLVCVVAVLSIICVVLGIFLGLKLYKQSKEPSTTQQPSTSQCETSTTQKETTTKKTTTTQTQPATTAPPTTAPPTTSPPPAPNGGELVTVNLDAESGNLLNIREGPGYDYGIKTRIYNGTVVTRLYQQNDWSYIDYGPGQGWCDTEVAGFDR